MMNLDSVSQAIEAALETGNIGQPVAVRMVVQAAADRSAPRLDAESLEAWTIEKSSAWLGDQLVGKETFASEHGPHACRLLRFSRGGMALCASGVSPPENELLQIVITGNRGIISWEDATTDALSAAAEPWPDRPAAGRDAAAPPYGVLLVSGDHTHQPNYAMALAEDPRCRLIGLTDETDITPRRRELNAELATRLNVPLLPDLDAALTRDDVAIVSVCAEPFRRGPIVVKAAKAGKHIYLDKPLAGSVEDARAIRDAVEQSQVAAHMFSLVHTAPVHRIREMISNGELGQLLAVHCDLSFAKGIAGSAVLGQPRVESRCPTQFELPDSKRELTNVGVYSLAMIGALLDAKVARVAAATGNFFFAEHQKNDMEDFGQMMLEMENGVLCSCTAGRKGWYAHPRHGLNRTYLVGTKKSVVVDADRPHAAVWSDAPMWPTPPRNPADPMGMWMMPKDSLYQPPPKTSWFTPPPSSAVTDASHFLDCIEFGRQPVVNADIAAHTTEVLMAAYESAAGDSVVALDNRSQPA